MVCTAGSSGVRRPPWEVLPSRRPIVHRPRADCEDDPEPGTHTSTSRKKGLAQGAAIRRHHQALAPRRDQVALSSAPNLDPPTSSGSMGLRSRIVFSGSDGLLNHTSVLCDVALPNPPAANWQQRAVLTCATVLFYLGYPWG